MASFYVVIVCSFLSGVVLGGLVAYDYSHNKLRKIMRLYRND